MNPRTRRKRKHRRKALRAPFQPGYGKPEPLTYGDLKQRTGSPNTSTTELYARVFGGLKR